MDPDPRRLLEAIRRAAEMVRDGHNPLSDGILALLASSEQRQTFDQVNGLMSLLEGHGDITMDRAGRDRIPGAERFSRVLRQRRTEQSGPVKLLQQAIGLDAKLRQYEEGERFIEAVERVGGPALLARAWDGPELLPTIDEIRAPEQWVARVGPSHLAPNIPA
jgi:putative hydrolase